MDDWHCGQPSVSRCIFGKRRRDRRHFGDSLVSLKDQALVYPNNISFKSPGEQESYVRQWLEERTRFRSTFKIKFYPAKFSTDKRSNLPVGDIAEMIPDEVADIAVLEEPEHLT